VANEYSAFMLASGDLSPKTLHPHAAAEFSDMLRSHLRSFLCVVPFGGKTRTTPVSQHGTNVRYHFAQTFPFRRRGLASGTFDWLETDPRPGVGFDLDRVPFAGNPPGIARGWEKLKRAFGLEELAVDEGARLYICPTVDWELRSGPDSRPLEDDQVHTPPKWTRAHMARHLAEEAEDWLLKRESADERSRFCVDGQLIPRRGTVVDAVTLESRESPPTTAVGMWVFQLETFAGQEATARVYGGSGLSDLSDLSETRPGLLLFDVGGW
jgi:hypothetical protein